MNINELGMKPETLQHRLYMSAALSLGDLMWGNKKPETPQAADREPKDLQLNQMLRNCWSS